MSASKVDKKGKKDFDFKFPSALNNKINK